MPHTYVDRVGAISVVEDPSQVGQEATVFENVDGKRIEDGRYAAFVEEISGFIPEARQVGVVLCVVLWCCCARSLARSRCALTRSLARFNDSFLIRCVRLRMGRTRRSTVSTRSW